MPGIFSWTIILSPVWGSFFAPYHFAYFILFFDIYWLYKSVSLAITSYIASNKIRTAEKIDWLKSARKLKNFKKVSHIIVIPNYTEPLYKLRETINALRNKTFPTKRIYIVLGMEKREKEAREKAQALEKEYKNVFGDIFAVYHPDIKGE